MDFLNTRRTGATYGKSNKKVLVHDLFDYRKTSVTSPEPSPHQQESSTVTTVDTIAGRAGIGTTAKDSRPSIPSPSPSTASSAPSPHNAQTETNVFDLSSSDGESDRGNRVDSYKKRKIVRPLREVVATKPAVKKRNISQLQQKSSITNVSVHAPEVVYYKHPTKTLASKQNSRGFPKAPKGGRQEKSLSATASLMNDSNATLQHSDIDSEHSVSVDESPGGDNSYLTDQSNKSLSRTPKRKRPTSQYSEESAPSPSSLAFTSLRLTPERGLRTIKTMSLLSTSDDDETPRKVRSRLIDRLDAPHQKPDSPSSSDGAFNSPVKASIKFDADGMDKQPLVNNTRLVNSSRSATQSNEEQPQRARVRATYGTKARTTYAKERSHLSEMADEMDILGSVPSNNTSQYLAPQRATSNLALQLELDDDETDDPAGPSKLKSIHELRKAGANNRYDREVQGLLEDIETLGTTSKSLRLQALMKLIRHADDPSFLRYMLDTERWTRLLHASSLAKDTLTAALFAVVCWVLSSAASPSTAPKLFQVAEKLAPQLLKSRSSMYHIAAERKSNLSKSMVREFSEFEHYLLEQLESRDGQHVQLLTLDQIGLTSLNQTLRKCLDFGVTVEKASTSCFSSVLTVLIEDANQLSEDSSSASGLFSIRNALQLLEACSIAYQEEDIRLSDVEITNLGSTLSKVMERARNQHEDFNKHVLRTVVSLSNNKPRFCQLLGRTKIIHTIFVTIDEHFQSVASQADLEQKLDESKLDLVILALGCLLNFAETDAEFRSKFASDRYEGHGHLERLVNMFSSQLSKVQDAVTQEQSQVLVAVGYLSMVLCALSLDATVRQQITHLLQDRPFEELCGAAETFLQHLRTLDGLASEDGSVSEFTARFNAILEAIRPPPT